MHAIYFFSYTNFAPKATKVVNYFTFTCSLFTNSTSLTLSRRTTLKHISENCQASKLVLRSCEILTETFFENYSNF